MSMELQMRRLPRLFRMSPALSALAIFAGALSFGHRAAAQANIPQLRGEYGIGSGTVKPPGAYAEMVYSTYEPAHVIARNAASTPRLHPVTDLIAAQLT